MLSWSSDDGAVLLHVLPWMSIIKPAVSCAFSGFVVCSSMHKPSGLSAQRAREAPEFVHEKAEHQVIGMPGGGNSSMKRCHATQKISRLSQDCSNWLGALTSRLGPAQQAYPPDVCDVHARFGLRLLHPMRWPGTQVQAQIWPCGPTQPVARPCYLCEHTVRLSCAGSQISLLEAQPHLLHATPVASNGIMSIVESQHHDRKDVMLTKVSSMKDECLCQALSCLF